MKKRILLLLLTAGIVTTGCSMSIDDQTNEEAPAIISESTESTAEQRYFKTLSYEAYGTVVYDTRTGVEYYISQGIYNRGTLTMLVDADGSPLIYTENEEIIDDNNNSF